MKIEKAALLSALLVAGKITSKGDMFPILSCVYLDGARGFLAATDLETTVVTQLDVRGAVDEDVFCVLHKPFTEIVKSVDAEDIEITFDPSAGKIDVNGIFKDVHTWPVEDFPEIPLGSVDTSTDINATVHTAALKAVLKAIPKTDDNGYGLGKIRFDADTGLIVGTNGHRLHTAKAVISKMSWNLPKEAVDAILAAAEKEEEIRFYGDGLFESYPVPDDYLDGLKKPQLLSLADDYFGQAFSPKATIAEIKAELMKAIAEKSREEYEAMRMVAVFEKTKVFVHLEKSMFPDYTAVLPKSYANTLLITRGDVKTALRQAKVMLNKDFRAARLSFNGGIDITVRNSDLGVFQKANIPVRKGKVDPSVEVAFNLPYLMDALATAPSDDEEIRVCLSSDPVKNPLVFEHGDLQALVMPVRI